MKFTESWLRELVDLPVSIDELARQLTMAGLEVEGISSCHPDFSDVVISRVKKIHPHPNITRLMVCLLDSGSSVDTTVVCGAKNVQPGHCYPLAKQGATLPAYGEIMTATVHEVISEGMLCSEKDLGLSENDEGIFELTDDAIPGMLLEDYLALHDTQVEIKLTPNRSDCLGMRGLAREVAVLNDVVLRPYHTKPTISSVKDKRSVSLNATAACPRYCGRIIHEVDITRKLPVAIAERLRRCGVRSVNPLVDLSHYVMLETGQPMHVFDNDTLQGNLEVRFARAEETIVLLDGEVRALTANTLVIADATGPIAIAGIMGGLSTAVTKKTRSVFIESAWFNPTAIMGRARHYSLHTEASHRFERGVDPAISPVALERLTELIVSITGGKAGPVQQVDHQTEIPAPKSIRLRSDRIHRLLGTSVSNQRISTILSQLGFGVMNDDNAEGEWNITVPSYRFDITIEADLIEEIARINGYHKIEGTLPMIRMQMKHPENHRDRLQTLTGILVARGYTECINYSFIDPAIQEIFSADSSPARLLNPISVEMTEMRQSLWPGLLQSLQYNIKRQQTSLRLFETGKAYLGNSGTREVRLVAGVIYGTKYNKQWDTNSTSLDFFDLKADVESLLFKTTVEFRRTNHRALHPGQSAAVLSEGMTLGILGALHPSLLGQLDLNGPVFLFELEVDKISHQRGLNYLKFSKYPSLRRDISIVLDENIPAAEVLDTIKKHVAVSLTNLELFDVYRGEGIDSGKKSLALGLTFQRSSSTLTDEEADVAIGEILESLRLNYGAKLRE